MTVILLLLTLNFIVYVYIVYIHCICIVFVGSVQRYNIDAPIALCSFVNCFRPLYNCRFHDVEVFHDVEYSLPVKTIARINVCFVYQVEKKSKRSEYLFKPGN